MVEAVIFDMGGVVHSLEPRKLSEMLAPRLGREVDDLRPHLIPLVVAMSIGEIDEPQFWERLGGKVDGIWEEQLASNRLYLPVVGLVAGLRKAKIRTAVLSNTIPPHMEIIRARGWYDYFDQVFLSPEIGLRKPDKRAYEYVLEQLKVKGEECVYVDDLEENLVPAGELGMKTILAVEPEQVVTEVNSFFPGLQLDPGSYGTRFF